MVSKKPACALDDDMSIALHFTEFHPGRNNKSQTAPLSAPNDVIRTLKVTIAEWRMESSRNCDAAKIFIYVISSTKY